MIGREWCFGLCLDLKVEGCYRALSPETLRLSQTTWSSLWRLLKPGVMCVGVAGDEFMQ